MVSGGQDLTATINMLTGGGGSGGGSGSTDHPQGKKTLGTIVKGVGGLAKSVAKGVGKKAGVMGINFGIAALLKQSQLFTGFIGSIFQILGGFVDVLIAPLMPLMFKGLAWVAKGIPWIQAKLSQFTGWIGGLWEASDGVGDFIKNLMVQGTQNIINWGLSLFDQVKGAAFWSGILSTVQGILLEVWDGVYAGLVELFPWLKPFLDELVIAVKNIWDAASAAIMPIFEAIKKLLVLIVPPLFKLWKWLMGKFWNYYAKPVITTLFPFLIKVVGGMIATIINTTTAIVKAIFAIWDGFVWLTDKINVFADWVKTFFTGGFNQAIISGVKSGVSWIGNKIMAVYNFIKGIPETLASAARTILDAVLEPIKNMISTISGLVGTLANPGKAISGAFDKVGGWFGKQSNAVDISVNGTSVSPQEMAQGRASVRTNIQNYDQYSTSQLLFDGG